MLGSIPLWIISALLFLGSVLASYLVLKGWYPVQKVFWSEMFGSSKWAGVGIVALSFGGLVLVFVLIGLSGTSIYPKILPAADALRIVASVLLLALIAYAALNIRGQLTKEVNWASVVKYTFFGLIVGLAMPIALLVYSTSSTLKIATAFQPTPQAVTRSGPVQFTHCYEPNFGFRVLMPEPRTEVTGLVHDKTSWNYEQKEGSYAIEVYKLPDSYDVSRFDERLNDYCNLEVAGLQGIETHRTPVALNGLYPGKEVEGTIVSQKKLFRFRFYIAKRYAFCTLVVGEPEWVNSNNAYTFMNSLKPSS